MPTCSRCGNEHDRECQRLCKPCHAANMKDWRDRNKRRNVTVPHEILREFLDKNERRRLRRAITRG